MDLARTTNGADALPASVFLKQASLCEMVGLYYSASILAGRASASFVLPPCICTLNHGHCVDFASIQSTLVVVIARLNVI